jgi:hypothetical protein
MVLWPGFERGFSARDESSRRTPPLPRLVWELWFLGWLVRFLWIVGRFLRRAWFERRLIWLARLEWRFLRFAWFQRRLVGIARIQRELRGIVRLVR